jgi:hypothetical protein
MAKAADLRRNLMADQNSDELNKRLCCLIEGMKKAELLLSHASDVGIALEKDVIQSIVQAREYCENAQDRDDAMEIEIKFWQATEKLAQLVCPVTVASLRADQELYDDNSLGGLLRTYILRRPQKISKATISVKRFRRWALTFLFLLIVVQIYWVIGTSVVVDIDKSILDYNNEVTVQQQNEQLLSDIKYKTSVQSASNVTGTTASPEELKRKIHDSESKLKEIELRFMNSHTILRGWSYWWEQGVVIFQSPLELLLKISGKETTKLISLPEIKGNYQRVQMDRSKAGFALYSIQVYLLPILWGVLGSITYVLRNLASRIKNICYTPDVDIDYRVRIVLGALAGLVIVWVIGLANAVEASHLKTLQSISPFAIAFVTGYSVEILFTTMDRFISAFTTVTPSKSTGIDDRKFT